MTTHLLKSLTPFQAVLGDCKAELLIYMAAAGCLQEGWNEKPCVSAVILLSKRHNQPYGTLVGGQLLPCSTSVPGPVFQLIFLYTPTYTTNMRDMQVKEQNTFGICKWKY